MKIGIGNDHVAIDLKETIKAHLESKGHEVVDFGTNDRERFDYPIAGYAVGRAVADGDVDLGILTCGTGIGISLAANKVHGVRACVCSDPYSARLSREHNDTNVLAFGARVVGPELAKMIVDQWLDASFEGGRHARRVAMLAEIEETQRLDSVAATPTEPPIKSAPAATRTANPSSATTPAAEAASEPKLQPLR